jgi:hypothetical protein
MFVVMGAVTVLLGLTDTMIPTPGSEFLGIYQTYLEQVITGALSSFWVVLALSVSLMLALLALAVVSIKRRKDKETHVSGGQTTPDAGRQNQPLDGGSVLPSVLGLQSTEISRLRLPGARSLPIPRPRLHRLSAL